MKVDITNPFAFSLPVLAFLFFSFNSYGQQEKKMIPDGTTGLILEIDSSDYLKKRRAPNEFEGTFSTIRVGLGYILDAATYSESSEFEEQMDSAGLIIDPKIETRDFRVMASGVFKTKRTLSWKLGYMYDGDKKVWLLRETGLTIGVPELFGHVFVGRTKEGYSMIKVMNGHSGITAERQMALDVIPILADGIKWFGYIPNSRIFWNLGYYNDIISKGQSFSTYKWQCDARIGWMPYYNKEKKTGIHFAANLRYGKPVDGKIVLKSRPESNPAPQIINTGTFNADQSTHIGTEFYYSNSKLLVGSEVMMHNFQSNEFEGHKFYGGDFIVSYIFTSGNRPYYTIGSILGFVNVKKSVFKGGIGEWEAVVRLSGLDLNDGSVHGGEFCRFTPMINWYMSKAVRMEFIYGYGNLNRFNLSGNLQIFQARLQLSLL